MNLRERLRETAIKARRQRAIEEANTAAEVIIELEAALAAAAAEGKTELEIQCQHPAGVRTLIARWAATPGNAVDMKYASGRMRFSW